MINPAFLNLSDAQLLALTIYGEARGETVDGQIAVGTIVLERVEHGGWYGSNIHEVCLKKYQFSCFNEFDKGYGKILHIAENWDEAIATNFSLMGCHALAVGLLAGKIPRTQALADSHAKNYLNPTYAAPTKEKWLGKGMNIVATIGNHEFFA